MRNATKIICFFISAFLLGNISFSQAEDGYDLTRKIWIDNHTRSVFILIPSVAGGNGPRQPSTTNFDASVYLVGEIHDQHPYVAEIQRPAINPSNGEPVRDSRGVPLKSITIPSHDNTFSRHLPSSLPANAYGYWVITGDKGNPDTVKTRPRPSNSLTSAPLAYAIKLDNQWLPLTSAHTIRQGIRKGLLKTELSNWGGLAWLSE